MERQIRPRVTFLSRMGVRVPQRLASLRPLFGLLLIATVAREAHGQKDEMATAANTLGAAAEAYLSNREAFRFIKCRFIATRGKIRSPEDALAGRFIDPVILSGLWLVSGTKVKYEIHPDRDYAGEAWKTFAKTSAKQATGRMSIVSYRAGTNLFLTDGQIQMRHAPDISTVNLYGPGQVGPSFTLTPFGMELMGESEVHNPGWVLRNCVEGSWHGRVNGIQKVDGHEVLSVSVGESPDTLLRTYCLDIKRGFLPILMWAKKPDEEGHIYKAFITSVRQCSEGRWFPERCVVAYSFDGSRPSPYGMELRVVELEVDRPPADDDFYLDIPKDTQVSVVPNKGAVIRTKAQEHVSLQNLPDLLGRCLAREAELLALQNQTGGRPAGRATLLMAVAIPALILAVVAVTIFLRRHRQGPAVS